MLLSNSYHVETLLSMRMVRCDMCAEAVEMKYPQLLFRLKYLNKRPSKITYFVSPSDIHSQ